MERRYAAAKSFRKSLNLKFRGKNSWPLFRHYLPGYLPWFVTSAQARVLATCLEQALDVLPRYRESPICCKTRIQAATSLPAFAEALDELTATIK